ncbi:enoyl-CoA hydratase/isomerase family protein [Paenarthrobacter ureafaciens]|uniref:enoyl-CoA hydratase/isomerase family protein n=1 Tax=Paenarthrobacter ureafaciens TaxID=37931 RepID=UPI003464C58B
METKRTVLVDVTNGIAQVTLNRPEARNAVNLAMCHDLREAFVDLDASDEVRVVVISAAGDVFCAGADLKERQGRDASWVTRRRQASFAAYAAIEACTKPVIAAVNGAVVGSGGEISMAADFIIGSENVRFRFPEPHWGTVGATQRLQRVVGKRMAKYLLYTNQVLDAHEAARLGLLTKVVAPEFLAQEVMATAKSIAAAPPLSIRLTKRAIDLGSETDLDRGIRIEMAAIEQCLADGGWKKGIEEFAASQGAK